MAACKSKSCPQNQSLDVLPPLSKFQTKNTPFYRCVSSSNALAGDESLSWHPLIEDFITVGRKLERLGFVHNGAKVIVINPEDMSATAQSNREYR
jgi:hypothetical protein